MDIKASTELLVPELLRSVTLLPVIFCSAIVVGLLVT